MVFGAPTSERDRGRDAALHRRGTIVYWTNVNCVNTAKQSTMDYRYRMRIIGLARREDHDETMAATMGCKTCPHCFKLTHDSPTPEPYPLSLLSTTAS